MSVQFRVRDMIPHVDREEVRRVFLRDGFRGIERHYTSDNEAVMMLIEHAGGDELRRERARLQPCGRKFGGKV